MSHIVLGVCGGIAAYKAAALCSLLRKSGHEVRVVMTDNATQFVAPLTFETLSGHRVITGMFDDERQWEINHISWAKWADAVVVAPATANILAKAAFGIADDMLSTLLLATSAPVLFAPAMNTQMLQNEMTQRNIAMLGANPRFHLMKPTCGRLACGDEGAGKMPEPDEIFAQVQSVLNIADKPNLLAGKTLLITSGPTREYLDPVRYISNPSSGAMGKAIAEVAIAMGAKHVWFVTGPVHENNLPQTSVQGALTIVRVTSALEMLAACEQHCDQADIFVFAAAVGDYRAEAIAPHKLKQKDSTEKATTLKLVENPDIAAIISSQKRADQFAVGFAAETQNVLDYARKKLSAKKLDMIVANEVATGFGTDNNEVDLLFADTPEAVHLPKTSKREIARQILEHIAQQITR